MILAIVLQSAPPAAPAEPWAIVSRTDAAGRPSVSASAPSIDGATRLTLRCDVPVKVVSLQFIPKLPLGAVPDKPVSIRFDQKPSLTSDWEFPGVATFTRDQATVQLLTFNLAHAKTVELVTTTDANFQVMARFAGPPSEQPIRAVLAACGYTLAPTMPAAPKPEPKP